jgi:hypothetical protein
VTATARMFWVDAADDRERASDGVSRYAAYVRQAARGFTEDAEVFDDPAAAWAVRAWNTACPPVMCPGFVAWHPRVLSARAERDEWAGDLRVTVDLVSALPESVARVAGYEWSCWRYEEWGERYEEPELRQAGRDKSLLPTMTASVLIAPASVFPTVAGPVPDWREAARAVGAVCRVLNAALGPIVAALDGGGVR